MMATGSSVQAQEMTRTQLSAQPGGSGVLSLTAKVADVEGAPVSQGVVSFETAKGSLGSVFVHDGTATLNLTNPPRWAKTVTAVYEGTGFASSWASTGVVADDTSSGLPGFTVTASCVTGCSSGNTFPLLLTPGQTGTVSLTVTSQNGFSEPVNLSCSGLPLQSQCTFNPVVVTPPANGSTISAMQIVTMATSGIANNQPGPLGRTGRTYALVIPGVLALVGIGALRRKNFGVLRMLGFVVLLAAGTLGMSACSQRYAYLKYHPAPNYGTAAGNFTIVVSAYSTNGTAVTNATSSDSSCSGAVCVAMTVQ